MPLVTLGATYAGTSLVTVVGGQARIVLRCVRGFDEHPQVRGEDYIVPGAAGRTEGDRVLDRHVLELAGFVAGTGETNTAQLSDYRAAMEELRALFDPLRDVATLVLDLENGETATLSSVRPLPTLSKREVGLPSYCGLSVELEGIGGSPWLISSGGS